MTTLSKPRNEGAAESPQRQTNANDQAPTILTSPVDGKQLAQKQKDKLPHGHCGYCKYEVFRHRKEGCDTCEKRLSSAKQRAGRRRTAVSAEPLVELREMSPPQLVRKCDYVADFLVHTLAEAEHPLSDWFRDLDMGDFELIIDASRGWRAHAGEEVIVQGDEVSDSAPGLFILEWGVLQAYKRSGGDEEHPGTLVKEYSKKGEIFGELAVFYGAPRAATVVAARDCFLWSIDRHTMVSVKRTCIENRRRLYDQLLQNVELLKPLGVEERAQLIDNLVPDHFEEGTAIVKQGEEASEFFLLERGEARAEIDGKVVAHYKRGNCFGELALVYDQPRAATVIATSSCKCLVLDRESFNRLLGPLESLHLHCSTAYVEEPPPSAHGRALEVPPSREWTVLRPRRCEMTTELKPEPEPFSPEPCDPEPRMQVKTPPRSSVGRMLEDCARKLTWFTSRAPKSPALVGTPPEPDYVMSPEDRLCYDSDEEQVLLDMAPVQGLSVAAQPAAGPPTVASCLEESEPPCAL